MDTWGRVVPLSGNDVVRWRFGNKGRFTVNSVYKALTVNDAGLNHRKIWRGEIPAKIKIFLWLVTIGRSEGNGMEIQHVFFVTIMKLSLISYFL